MLHAEGVRMRTRKPQTPRSTPPADGFRHSPFRALAKTAVRLREAKPPQAAAPPPGPEPTEADLFQREMANVRRLSAAPPRVAQAPPAQPPREIVDPDAEVLAELSDLVTGVGPFDITNTTEYLEGAVVGLDPRLVRRLRAGEFAFQSHLDLHGLNAAAARLAVDHFLARAYQRGQRCVLIVHGRGLNSEGHNPVLKKRLATWLARGGHARLVLAFTSARACDGGAGAIYVLLRRQRHGKRPLRVTEGSKA
jgi:DNA-nicking Smr family endonuclease